MQPTPSATTSNATAATTAPNASCVGTVLFTDLVGFTEFNDAVGDAEAIKVLEVQTRLAQEMVATHPGARLVKELGDGLMVWFDEPSVALRSAVALLTAIDGARRSGTFPLAIRMGLHHGEALTRRDDVVGNTINVGARVADLAGPGELLVSDAAVAATQPTDLEHIPLAAVGPVHVKGVHEPIWLQRVES